MTWVRIDDGMPDHPKIAGLSAGAFRAHVRGICYAARMLTDGRVPDVIAKRIGKPREIRELLAANVWDEHIEGGYVIHDFLDYNPSAKTVRADRDRTAARVRNWRETRKSNAPSNSVTPPASNAPSNGDGNAPRNPVTGGEVTPLVTPPPSPTPTPTPEEPVLDQSSLVAPAAIDHHIRDTGIGPATQAAIIDLVAVLHDATDGTIGRLVNLARDGAPPAFFHDARMGVTTTHPRSPSRVACAIIANRLEGRP